MKRIGIVMLGVFSFLLFGCSFNQEKPVEQSKPKVTVKQKDVVEEIPKQEASEIITESFVETFFKMYVERVYDNDKIKEQIAFLKQYLSPSLQEELTIIKDLESYQLLVSRYLEKQEIDTMAGSSMIERKVKELEVYHNQHSYLVVIEVEESSPLVNGTYAKTLQYNVEFSEKTVTFIEEKEVNKE